MLVGVSFVFNISLIHQSMSFIELKTRALSIDKKSTNHVKSVIMVIPGICRT